MAGKIRYLDSLRGLAALAVVFCHFAAAFYPALTDAASKTYSLGFEPLVYSTPLYLFFSGGFAVDVFFVLSGYVLTYKFFASGDQSLLTSSAIRRYFRLLAPILFSLLCTFAVLVVFLHSIDTLSNITGINELKTYFAQPPDLVEILRQAFWGSFFDGGVDYNHVLWTMGIEFLGSLLVFSMASLFGKARHRWVFYLGAGLFLFNTFYLGFILGMVLADAYNGKSREKFAIRNSLILLMLLCTGLFIGSYRDHSLFGKPFMDLIFVACSHSYMFINSFGAFLILLVLLNSRQLQAALSNRYLSLLGKVSFSMYLMHMLVFGSFSVVLFGMLLNNFGLPYFTSLAITFPLSLLAVFGVSYLTCRYVDANGIRLSKWISDTYFAPESKPGSKPFGPGAAKQLITSLGGKNLCALLAVLVLLVVAAAGATVFLKPVVDHENYLKDVSNAEQSYLQDKDDTVAAYQKLSAYSLEPVNNSSLGDYKRWTDGYRTLALNLSNTCDDMQASGTRYESYLNESSGEQVADDLSYYSAIVHDSMNQSRAYDAVYTSWYWNHPIGV